MNVADRVTVAGRGGIVTRVFPSGWLRVAIDGDKGLPQDYPASSCRPAPGRGDLDGWCWCGDRISRHAAPCTPQDGQEAVTRAPREESVEEAVGEPSVASAAAMPTWSLDVQQPACCETCGAVLVAGRRGQVRRYCSPRCRVAAHRAKV